MPIVPHPGAIWARAHDAVNRQLARLATYAVHAPHLQGATSLAADPQVAEFFQRSYTRRTRAGADALVRATVDVFTALCYRPVPPAAPIDLQVLANGIVGDTHAFDAGTIRDRYLSFLLDRLYPAPGSPPDSNAAEVRAALYARAQIDVGRTASTVLVSGLLTGESGSETVLGDGYAVLLPRASLDVLPLVAARNQVVFAFENPTVLQGVVDALRPNALARPWPTLLCTWGWPSLAARALLDGLPPSTTLQYSGDLDFDGVRIADWLEDRYSHRLTFRRWRMTPNDYQLGIARNWPGRSWTEAQLAATAARHPDLVARIREFEHFAAVNQETLQGLLDQDVRDAVLGVV